jgi:hypothetical protein
VIYRLRRSGDAGKPTFAGADRAINICGGAGVFCDTPLGLTPQPFEGTIYVNFLVGSSGGQIARGQVDQ